MLPIVALMIGGSVLTACAMIMSRTLTEPIRWPRLFRLTRRRARPAQRVVARYVRPWRRGAVTGSRLTLADAPLPELVPPLRRAVTAPARQLGRAPDILTTHPDVVAAERTIEHLLETDPDKFAGLIMHMIDEDRQLNDHPDDHPDDHHSGRGLARGQDRR